MLLRRTGNRQVWSPVLRRGLAHVDVIALLAVVLFCIALLVQISPRSREMARRTFCMRNLKDIGYALYVYSSENNEAFPVPAHPRSSSDIGNVDYTRAIGTYRGKAGDPGAGRSGWDWPSPAKLSTTRGLWMLFKGKGVVLDRFVCPATADRPNDEPNARDYWDFGVGDITGPATPDQSRVGFSQVSYGYVIPYGPEAPTADASFNVIVADRGPFGASIEGDAPPPPAISTLRSERRPGWRPWNSPNHRGEGQHVFGVDLGVDFIPQPVGASGHYYENFYTRFGFGTKLRSQALGDPPTPGGCEVPVIQTDSMIYP